jgi:hypothetical protein
MRCVVGSEHYLFVAGISGSGLGIPSDTTLLTHDVNYRDAFHTYIMNVLAVQNVQASCKIGVSPCGMERKTFREGAQVSPSSAASDELDALIGGPLRRAMQAAGVDDLVVNSTSTHTFWSYQMHGHREQVLRRAGLVEHHIASHPPAPSPEPVESLSDDAQPEHDGLAGAFVLFSDSQGAAGGK